MKKQKKGNPKMLLFSSAMLVLVGATLRFSSSRLCYGINTGNYSSYHLTTTKPDPIGCLIAAFNEVFGMYARDYLLPVLIFLLPAIILFAIGITQVLKKDSGIFEFLKNPKKEKIFIAALFLICFLGTLGAHFMVFGNYPTISDEFSYLFEADVLAAGKLYVASPPMNDFFQMTQVVNDGKWYSKYTIGWPLLLAIGKIIRMEFIIGPLCAALTVLLLYLAGKRILGHKGGLIASLFGLISPYVILTGGNYYTHVAVGLFAILFLHLLLLSFEKKSFIYPALAGIAAGFIFHLRPGDGTLVNCGMVPLAALLFWKSEDKKNSAIKTVIFMIFLSIMGLGLLAVNKVQTGNPFVFAFEKFYTWEKYGFGNRRPYADKWDMERHVCHHAKCFLDRSVPGDICLTFYFRKEQGGKIPSRSTVTLSIVFCGVVCFRLH